MSISENLLTPYARSTISDIQQREIERKKNVFPSNMYDNLILSLGNLVKGEVILVNARTNKERSLIHEFAKQQKVFSRACQYGDFSREFTYKCKDCKTICSQKDFGLESDWSTDGRSYYGEVGSCKVCGNIYASDDPEDFLVWQNHNCVIISKDILVNLNSEREHASNLEVSENLQFLDISRTKIKKNAPTSRHFRKYEKISKNELKTKMDEIKGIFVVKEYEHVFANATFGKLKITR